jgi:hypothetical protein
LFKRIGILPAFRRIGPITQQCCQNNPTNETWTNRHVDKLVEGNLVHMLTRITSILLIVLLANIACPSRAFAGGKQEKEAKFAQKMKTELEKIGIGPDARVEVKMRDNTKLKGHISEISYEYFVVVDDKTGSATRLTYSQVEKVKGYNLSSGAKIAIGVGIVVAVIFIIALIAVPHVAQ